MSDVTLGIGPPGEPEARLDEDALAGELPVDELAGELGEAPQVDASMVRPLIAAAGYALHELAGDEDVEGHWLFTDRELDDLAPPLTRIINRRPQLRRAVMHGDELVVAVVLASYAGRNVTDARRAQEERDGHLNGEGGATAHANGSGPRRGAETAEPWDGGRGPGAGDRFPPAPG